MRDTGTQFYPETRDRLCEKCLFKTNNLRESSNIVVFHHLQFRIRQEPGKTRASILNQNMLWRQSLRICSEMPDSGETY
jgi:hypothetical protein